MQSAYTDPTRFASSIATILQQRATSTPTQIAYQLRQTDVGSVAQITFGELDRQARNIAAWLQQQGASGERALLLYPFGLDFIAGFYGCLYAGVVAVPLYPPRPNRPDARLLAVMADAQPKVALTTAKVINTLNDYAGMTPELQQLQWVATDTLADEYAAAWQPYTPDVATLAFLQYTSGSTGLPKGVMVRHANILHNAAMICQAFAVNPHSTGLIWTPFFHDMGLIGGVVLPVYTGSKTTLIAPVDFLQQPSRWLQAISEDGVTISGGPNFAYELCIDKITPEQCTGLDLSTWAVAFCGAEPVRAGTLERFTAKFAPYGFRAQAFTPCFGMAETTLMATCTPQAKAPVIVTLDSAALARHQVRPTFAASAVTQSVQHLVSNGPTWLDHTVSIVDPQTQTRCAADQVGEIWVRGSSVTGGYWQRPVETAQTFGATLAESGEGPFLRTGDLGFVHQGELFVTGRLKDLIIIRGKNYYPQDLEATAETAHPALQVGGAAAFAVDVAEQEALVLAVEVGRTHLRTLNTDEVVAAIGRAIAQEHELQVAAIVLLRPGRLLKTSSGKVQRQACRQAYLQNELDAVATWAFTPPSTVAAATVALPPAPASLDHKAITDWITGRLAQRLGVTPLAIDLDRPFAEFGLDSLAAVALVQELDGWLQGAGHQTGLRVTDLWDFPTIAALANYLVQSTANADPIHVDSAPLTMPTVPSHAPLPPTTGLLEDEVTQELLQLARLLSH